MDKYEIDKIIKNFFPKARIHTLPKVTAGAVITCINGLGEIRDELPIVFNDCDHLFKCNEFNDFCEKSFDETVDGLLLTFRSNEPKYSFIEKDENENVIRTVEKEAISDEAICGCSYFRNKELFLKCAEQYLKNCNYSEYFMSGIYNVMISQHMTVKSMKTDYHVSYGVPEEYEKARNDMNYKELI